MWQVIPKHASGPWMASPWLALLYVYALAHIQHIHIDTLDMPTVDPGTLALQVEELLRFEVAGLDALTVQVEAADEG